VSRSLAASCVILERRSLRSTGVTRLHHYYEPLRHPRQPSLSLAGVWLTDHSTTDGGFPCCWLFPAVHAVATTPAELGGSFVVCFPSEQRPSLLKRQVGFRIITFEAF
jgi:hypothetical protein